jgi:putative ABC transport system permease protein
VRSGLTILGIVIGVAAVIAMLAVGAGAQNRHHRLDLGHWHQPAVCLFGNMQEEVRNPQPLTLGDAEAIADPLPGPVGRGGRAGDPGNLEVTFGRERERRATLRRYTRLSNGAQLRAAEGRVYHRTHMLARSVAVIGPEVAERCLGARRGNRRRPSGSKASRSA